MIAQFNESADFSKKEKLINEIKKNGYLKFRNKPTISPYIMAKWALDDMVEGGTLTKENTTEGSLFFRKKYIVYKLK